MDSRPEPRAASSRLHGCSLVNCLSLQLAIVINLTIRCTMTQLSTTMRVRKTFGRLLEPTVAHEFEGNEFTPACCSSKLN